MVVFILFIFGLVFGSFIGVVIDRLPTGRSIITGRSRCEYCKKILTGWDLIPLFSFLFLRARCRYCQHSLSLLYPAIELASALILILTWFWISIPALFILYSILFLSFLALFVIDCQHHLLPDYLVGLCLVIAFILMVIFKNNTFVSLASGIIAALSFLLLVVATRGRGMGMGDVKLVFVMGILLGWQVLLAIYIAFLTGGMIALILVLMGKKRFGQTIAFGPFLLLGTIITVVWGGFLIKHFFPF